MNISCSDWDITKYRYINAGTIIQLEGHKVFVFVKVSKAGPHSSIHIPYGLWPLVSDDHLTSGGPEACWLTKAWYHNPT